MTRRIRGKENTDQEEEGPISVEEALNTNVEVTIYDKFAEIVSQYGSNLLLRIYTIKSDNRSLGFIDEIIGDEIDLFLQAPEAFLRDRFGPGTFRIIVVNGGTKKFITNLTISISSPKNLTPNPNTDYLGEVTKSFKEGLNLGKSSSQSNNHFPFDMTKLIELVMLQQERSKEREDKNSERIRNAETHLREKELALLEKTLSNNSEVGKQFQPMIEFMSQSGKVLSSAMSMIERSADFLHNITPSTSETPFWERILIGLGDRLLTSQPQLLEKLIPMIPQIRLPQVPTTSLQTNVNPPSEHKTPKEEPTPRPETPPNQFNFENAFPVMLLNQVDRATMNIEPDFCAECLLADIEVLSKKGLITIPQMDQAHNLLISDQLEAYIQNFFPDVVKYKAWLIEFQSAIKEGISEPQEGESEPMKQ